MRHTDLLRHEAGFTVIGLMIIFGLVGVFVLPFMRITASSIEARQTREAAMSETVLAPARDALIAFAAANNGCLPFAADFEGGLPDTDQTGATSPTYADSGVGTANRHAGDLPWAELGLAPSEKLRVQYYVASAYADPTGNCYARFRGFEWNSSVTYLASETNPLYVYLTVVGDPDAVALAQQPAGAGNLTLNGALVTAGTAVFATAQRVSVYSDKDESIRSFTIFGTDKDGLTIQEVVNGPILLVADEPDTVAVDTTATFLTVTQVAIDGGASGNITVGTASGRRLYKITEFLPASMAPDTPEDPFETIITVNAPPNSTSITVADATGFSIGDFIGISLNSGRRHITTVAGLPSGTTIDLADGISGSAAGDGNKVRKASMPDDVTDALPGRMLEVRVGPDVTGGGGSETVTASAQNVFMLIAPGNNRNAELDRGYVRDSNHVDGSTGLSWTLDVANVDSMIFSNALNTDAVDQGSDGDDTLLAMSFAIFKEKIGRYGLNMEPVCESTAADPDPC